MRSLLLACIIVVIAAAPTGVLARTWHVPSEVATIQAAIDSAAAGDTVLVATGTYTWSGQATGNANGLIRMKSGVTLRSATGSAECVTLDAEYMGRVIHCEGVDNTAKIQGFTIINGLINDYSIDGPGAGIYCKASSPAITNCDFKDNNALESTGGGLACYESSSPTVQDCILHANSADLQGGGIICVDESSANITRCTFSDNISGFYGGALECDYNSDVTVTNCTLSGNRAASGGGISCWHSSPRIETTIIAYSKAGGAVYCDEAASPTLSCCDIYHNTGGDYTGCIAGMNGVDGNFSMCRSFCLHDVMPYDFSLCDESPCLPGNHPDAYVCGLIGAWPMGCICGPSRLETTAWGMIKAMYR